MRLDAWAYTGTGSGDGATKLVSLTEITMELDFGYEVELRDSSEALEAQQIEIDLADRVMVEMGDGYDTEI